MLCLKPGFVVQFVPFIQGPRNCLGQNFALLEARIVLALIVKVSSASMNTSLGTSVHTSDPVEIHVLEGNVALVPIMTSQAY